MNLKNNILNLPFLAWIAGRYGLKRGIHLNTLASRICQAQKASPGFFWSMKKVKKATVGIQLFHCNLSHGCARARLAVLSERRFVAYQGEWASSCFPWTNRELGHISLCTGNLYPASKKHRNNRDVDFRILVFWQSCSLGKHRKHSSSDAKKCWQFLASVKPFSLNVDNIVSCPFPAAGNEFGAGKICQCSKGLFGPQNHCSTSSQLASPTRVSRCGGSRSLGRTTASAYSPVIGFLLKPLETVEH